MNPGLLPLIIVRPIHVDQEMEWNYITREASLDVTVEYIADPARLRELLTEMEMIGIGGDEGWAFDQWHKTAKVGDRLMLQPEGERESQKGAVFIAVGYVHSAGTVTSLPSAYDRHINYGFRDDPTWEPLK